MLHSSICSSKPPSRRILASWITSPSSNIWGRGYSSSLRSLDGLVSLRNQIQSSSLIYNIWSKRGLRNVNKTIIVIIVPKFSLWFSMLAVNRRNHTIIIGDGGSLGNNILSRSGQQRSWTHRFLSFFVLCTHKFLILTTLSKQILLSLTTASFIKPNFV